MVEDYNGSLDLIPEFFHVIDETLNRVLELRHPNLPDIFYKRYGVSEAKQSFDEILRFSDQELNFSFEGEDYQIFGVDTLKKLYVDCFERYKSYSRNPFSRQVVLDISENSDSTLNLRVRNNLEERLFISLFWSFFPEAIENPKDGLNRRYYEDNFRSSLGNLSSSQDTFFNYFSTLENSNSDEYTGIFTLGSALREFFNPETNKSSANVHLNLFQ